MQGTGRVNNTVPSMTQGLGWCPTAKSRTKCNGLRTTVNLSRSLSFHARPGPTFFFTFSLPPLGWPFFSAWKPPPGLGTQASHKLTSVQLLLTFPPPPPGFLFRLQPKRPSSDAPILSQHLT